MAGRYEISNDDWKQIEDIVSPTQAMGRPRPDDRHKDMTTMSCVVTGRSLTLSATPGQGTPDGVFWVRLIRSIKAAA